MLRFFINSMGYEVKFEAERGVVRKKGGPMNDHFHKINSHKKDDDDAEEEEDSHSSNHKTEWEKMVDKYGGDTKQSSEPQGGAGSVKNKGKQQQGVEGNKEKEGSDSVLERPATFGSQGAVI